MRVTGHSGALYNVVVADFPFNDYVKFDQAELDAGRLIERPIQVGDTVTPSNGSGYVHKVLAIVGPHAWVRSEGLYPVDSIRAVAALVRAPA